MLQLSILSTSALKLYTSVIAREKRLNCALKTFNLQDQAKRRQRRLYCRLLKESSMAAFQIHKIYDYVEYPGGRGSGRGEPTVAPSGMSSWSVAAN